MVVVPEVVAADGVPRVLVEDLRVEVLAGAEAGAGGGGKNDASYGPPLGGAGAEGTVGDTDELTAGAEGTVGETDELTAGAEGTVGDIGRAGWCREREYDRRRL